MKCRFLFLIVLTVLILDQGLKIYVKSNFSYGESFDVLGDWFKIHLIENRGMAFGINLGGDLGKFILTAFRIIVFLYGTWFLFFTSKSKYHPRFWISVSLIYAGALGNVIDSTMYGLIFDKGITYDSSTNEITLYYGIAKLSFDGYGSFMFGNVVDMLHFPLFEFRLPSWFPIWPGRQYEFFSMIFNIADSSIFIGVMIILIWNNTIFKYKKTEKNLSAMQGNFQEEIKTP